MAREQHEAKQLAELLDYLKRSRGFDFSGYKKTTLSRRIEKRMGAVGAAGFADYQDYLEVNPREFTELFNTILINVTSFFRDPQAWDFIAADVIPRLLEDHPRDQPLRIWSAGCASGEEAYTVAMALVEAMGEEAFKARVKIYATDLDDDALAAARHGVYTNDALKPLSEDLVQKYFEPNTRGLAFRPDLRRAIIFGRNDLTSDAPISRIDLLVCRNVLMYFTPEAQASILARFNFALNPAGYLFLGKSEMLISHGELFSPYSLTWRVFRRVQRNSLRERLAFVAPDSFTESVHTDDSVRTATAALSPVAQIVIDGGGYLVDVNPRARDLFGIVEGDIGKPFQDVPLSYRPADLRTAIDQATAQQAPIRLNAVRYAEAAGGERVLDIEVAPVYGSNNEHLGSSVLFSDVTLQVRLEDDYQHSKRELENAYEELQSTVEELETMNEELQSTNDELETMNTEVNTRAVELDRVNLFLEGILGSLSVSVVVIDREHRVQVWNAMSSDMWGLRADEVEGTDFFALDIGLPVRQLEDAIARAFGGSKNEIEERVEAVNRRGQHFTCRVRVVPLRTTNDETYASMVLASPAAGDTKTNSGD